MLERDVYLERIVPRKMRAAEIVVLILLVVMAVSAALTRMAGLISFLFGILCLGLACFLYTRMRIDFEYAYTSGILDIAIIYNKARRDEVASINLSENMILLANQNAKELAGYGVQKPEIRDYTSRRKDAEIYILVYKEGGEVRMMLLEPGKEMLEAIGEAYGKSVVVE